MNVLRPSSKPDALILLMPLLFLLLGFPALGPGSLVAQRADPASGGDREDPLVVSPDSL